MMWKKFMERGPISAFACLAVVAAASTASAQIVVSEFLSDADASTEPSGVEFIEIYNAGDTAVDIGGYILTDEEAIPGTEGAAAFPAGTSIDAGEVIVATSNATSLVTLYPDVSGTQIFEWSDSDSNAANDLVSRDDLASNNIALSNGGDDVLLLDASEQFIDGVTYGGNTFTGATALSGDPDKGTSAIRGNLDNTPANADDWVLDQTPTPGAVPFGDSVDTCADSNPCGANEDCSDTPLGPECDCSEGFVREGSGQCIPSCTTAGCAGTGEVCNDGSGFCECDEENLYVDNGSGTCELVECVESDDCSATGQACSDNTCACRPGFELNGAETACEPGFTGTYTLVITEFVSDDAAQSGEFVEIYNFGDTTLDISGVTLSDEEAPMGTEGAGSFPAGTSIAAGETIVATESIAAITDSASAYAPEAGTQLFEWGSDSDSDTSNDLVDNDTIADGSIALSNGGDEIILYDLTGGVIDAVTYGGNSFDTFPDVAAPGDDLSAIRQNLDNTPAQAADWASDQTPTPGTTPFGVVVDPCEGITCDANEICDGTSGTAECVCDTGFVDDGTGTCIESCDTAGCATGDGETCDTGSGLCICDAENLFVDDGNGGCEQVACIDNDDCTTAGESCVDNECINDDPCFDVTCGDNEICDATSGNAECVCDAGFVDDGTGACIESCETAGCLIAAGEFCDTGSGLCACDEENLFIDDGSGSCVQVECLETDDCTATGQTCDTDANVCECPAGQVVDNGACAFVQTVVITEFLSDGAEFIEIYNTTQDPIDISGYTVADEETPGGGEGASSFPEGTIIQSGEVIIATRQILALGASAYPAPQGTRIFEWIESDDNAANNLIQNDAIGTSLIALNNTFDEVLLFNADDALIDAVGYGGSPIQPFPTILAPDDDTSAIRDSLDNQPALSTDWLVNQTPTPGEVQFKAPNGDCTDITCGDNEVCVEDPSGPFCACTDGFVDDGTGACIEDCATALCDTGSGFVCDDDSGLCICPEGTTDYGDGTCTPAAAITCAEDTLGYGFLGQAGDDTPPNGGCLTDDASNLADANLDELFAVLDTMSSGDSQAIDPAVRIENAVVAATSADGAKNSFYLQDASGTLATFFSSDEQPPFDLRVGQVVSFDATEVEIFFDNPQITGAANWDLVADQSFVAAPTPATLNGTDDASQFVHLVGRATTALDLDNAACGPGECYTVDIGGGSSFVITADAASISLDALVEVVAPLEWRGDLSALRVDAIENPSWAQITPAECSIDDDCDGDATCIDFECIVPDECDATTPCTGTGEICDETGVSNVCVCDESNLFVDDGTGTCISVECIAATDCTVTGQLCESNACACPTDQIVNNGACVDAPEAGSILITEFQPQTPTYEPWVEYDENGDITPETDGQFAFVELYNPGVDAIDVGGFVLASGLLSDTDTLTVELPPSTTIEGGEYLILAISSDFDMMWNVTADVLPAGADATVAGDLLNGTGGALYLYGSENVGDDDAVDAVGYGDGASNVFGTGADVAISAPGYVIERSFDGTNYVDTDSDADWLTDEVPTPGAANDTVSTTCDDGSGTLDPGEVCDPDVASDTCCSDSCVPTTDTSQVCLSTDMCAADDVTCDGVQGGCIVTPLDIAVDGASCDDGNGTADEDTCEDGLCIDGTPTSVCGDNVCDADEDETSCPQDCSTASTCGDNVCDADEDETSCPQDCATGGVCGDNVCDADEDETTCPQDCSTDAVCGDGVVEGDEECDGTENCSDDCTIVTPSGGGGGGCSTAQSVPPVGIALLAMFGMIGIATRRRFTKR